MPPTLSLNNQNLHPVALQHRLLDRTRTATVQEALDESRSLVQQHLGEGGEEGETVRAGKGDEAGSDPIEISHDYIQTNQLSAASDAASSSAPLSHRHFAASFSHLIKDPRHLDLFLQIDKTYNDQLVRLLLEQ
jgi:hypothetical protein